MFPLSDSSSRVIAFSGRSYPENKDVPKYLNSPETEIFQKSKTLFGFDKAKAFIKKHNFAILVEGQMDVIACHQAGMTNVVATSGTALTEEQIALLKRYSNNLAIAFDADAAGINAARRGIEIALAAGMNIRIIRIPDGAGKDPDECIKKDFRVEWILR